MGERGEVFVEARERFRGVAGAEGATCGSQGFRFALPGVGAREAAAAALGRGAGLGGGIERAGVGSGALALGTARVSTGVGSTLGATKGAVCTTGVEGGVVVLPSRVDAYATSPPIPAAAPSQKSFVRSAVRAVVLVTVAPAPAVAAVTPRNSEAKGFSLASSETMFALRGGEETRALRPWSASRSPSFIEGLLAFGGEFFERRSRSLESRSDRSTGDRQRLGNVRHGHLFDFAQNQDLSKLIGQARQDFIENASRLSIGKGAFWVCRVVNRFRAFPGVEGILGNIRFCTWAAVDTVAGRNLLLAASMRSNLARATMNTCCAASGVPSSETPKRRKLRQTKSAWVVTKEPTRIRCHVRNSEMLIVKRRGIPGHALVEFPRAHRLITRGGDFYGKAYPSDSMTSGWSVGDAKRVGPWATEKLVLVSGKSALA